MENMTPQQALEILDKATNEYHGTRSDHVRIQQALQVLVTLVHQSNGAKEADIQTNIKDTEKDTEPDNGQAE